MWYVQITCLLRFFDWIVIILVQRGKTSGRKKNVFQLSVYFYTRCKIRKVVCWAHSLTTCRFIRSKFTGRIKFSQPVLVLGVVARSDHSTVQKKQNLKIFIHILLDLLNSFRYNFNILCWYINARFIYQVTIFLGYYLENTQF